MNVRFARSSWGEKKLLLCVVPETDADRIALAEFAKTAKSDCENLFVEMRVEWYMNHELGIDSSSLKNIGPKFLGFSAVGVVSVPFAEQAIESCNLTAR